MKKILLKIQELDKKGHYKKADYYTNKLVKIAALPYSIDALDELPLSARNVSYQNNEGDYQEYDRKFWDELKQRIPDYMQLNTDQDDEDSMEGKLTGQPDSVPGPAYVLPGEEGVSPSQSNLGDFDWDKIRNTNNDPEGWVNLQPRR
jgi:hypothetical protein